MHKRVMASQQENNNSKLGILHPRNPHQGKYDFKELCKTSPELETFLRPHQTGGETIDFSDEKAVLCLNKSLLSHYYQVKIWAIPSGYLCPPIPGRADYIHHLADLLAGSGERAFPTGKRVKALDIGTGANCIYPIIGSQSYGWQFVGSDSDPVSIQTARMIVQSNNCLKKRVKIVEQSDKQSIFNGVIKEGDRVDVTLCNPPFHFSMTEAESGNMRKWSHLNKETDHNRMVKFNFGGQKSELCYLGGELAFIKQMVKESYDYANQVCWFTSLVSKGGHIGPLKRLLARAEIKQLEVVKMSQGRKQSRFIAWSFLNSEQQESWAQKYWDNP